MLRHVPVIALVLLAGCKESPKERAQRTANAKDFWPEAPKPTPPSAPRALRYKPDNMNGYLITATGGSTPGAIATVSFSMTMDMAFKTSSTGAARDGFLKRFDMTMDAAGQGMKMRFDGNEIFVSAPGQEAVTIKRSDDNPILNVAEIAEKPFFVLDITDGTTVSMRGASDHPLIKLGGGGDMMDNAVVMFPDLPKEAVQAGHTWTIKRDTPLGTTGTKVPVTYTFVYAGDASCPSGAKTCSVLDLTAEANNVKAEQNGFPVTASFGFAGKVYLDYEKGAVDESRVQMNIDVAIQDQKMPMTATFAVKPTT